MQGYGFRAASLQGTAHPLESHTQARIMQFRPPYRWQVSEAMFCARPSVGALAQPCAPQALAPSIAKAAHDRRKLVTILQSCPLHCARARNAAASGDTSSNA